jgi:hypothetical protein
MATTAPIMTLAIIQIIRFFYTPHRLRGIWNNAYDCLLIGHFLKNLRNFFMGIAGTPPGCEAAVASRETGSNCRPRSPELAA